MRFKKVGTLYTYGDSVAQEFPADDVEETSAGNKPKKAFLLLRNRGST